MADDVGDVIMDTDENDVDIISPTKEEFAESKKEEGNNFYKLKQYNSALPLYTEAISICPDVASYYNNRSACFMMLNRFHEALEDARQAVKLDPTSVKGYVRLLKCAIAMGDIVTAENAAAQLEKLNDGNNTGANEIKSLERLKHFEVESQKAYAKKDYRKVVYCMDRCLDEAPTCSRYKTTKAECLAFLGRYSEARDIANNILHLDKGNADAIYVRGICLFYEDNIDNAFSHFQQVLRLAPDHAKAMEIYKRAKLLKKKKDDGNAAYKSGRMQEAYDLYTEALNIDPLNKKTNAKLYFNRANVLSQQNKLKEAVENCSMAIKLDDTYMKALLRRAKCYMDLGEYESAVQDYEKINKIDKSRDNRRLLQEAKMALKRSKRKDYYKILGIERNATDDEIKKAYRKRALIHHPDRHANASENEKKEQEVKFKELGEAYGVLSDPKKKGRYDSGQDLEDFDGGMSDIDPTHVFQSFFRQSSGGEFSFGGGFPGNFNFQFGG